MLVASLVAQTVTRLPGIWETKVRSLGWEDPLEKEMPTHSSILAWEVPCTEKSGGPELRVGHNLVPKPPQLHLSSIFFLLVFLSFFSTFLFIVNTFSPFSLYPFADYLQYTISSLNFPVGKTVLSLDSTHDSTPVHRGKLLSLLLCYQKGYKCLQSILS